MRQQSFPFVFCTFKAEEKDIQALSRIKNLANDVWGLKHRHNHRVSVLTGPLEESKKAIRERVVSIFSSLSPEFGNLSDEDRICFGQVLQEFTADYLSNYDETIETFEYLPVDKYNPIFDGLWEGKYEAVKRYCPEPDARERFIQALENYHTFNTCFEKQLRTNKEFHYKSFMLPPSCASQKCTEQLDMLIRDFPYTSEEKATLFQPMWE